MKALFALVVFCESTLVVSAQANKADRTSFEIRKGDTVNYVDRRGRPQGRHYMGDTVETDYLDGHVIKETHYFQNGKVRLALTSDIKILLNDFQFRSDSLRMLQLNHLKEYYESGVKKKECNSRWSQEAYLGDCDEWDEKGEKVTFPVKIVHFSYSECKGDPLTTPNKLERISEIKQHKKNITYTLEITASCGTRFIPVAQVNRGELQFRWRPEDDDVALCACYYQLHYTVEWPDPNVTVKYWDREIPYTTEEFERKPRYRH
jgi:hypothetical protein